MSETENNEIIAEFMNVDQVDIDTYLETNEELKYHTSWDCLMPVVEKIERKGCEVEIRSTDCIIYYITDEQKYKPIADGSSGAGKIVSTYEAIIEFIKWYNENKED